MVEVVVAAADVDMIVVEVVILGTHTLTRSGTIKMEIRMRRIKMKMYGATVVEEKAIGLVCVAHQNI